ncbi:helix-turn-helix domain-containing protein [Thermus sp. SYSU G05001]|uniref:Helix-turn-helix domain-containing protein n=1 Tax=Thermus brevis TaxID=2862456 RepID=A0ABS6ZZ06_9DEIN|nr:helix-turn-helix domain-containing protein [Thermus brevis]MBW6395253.1 helix-turn-helix domain-containing protein [Thermus brevis]
MSLRELLERHGLADKATLTFREVADLLGVGRPAVEELVRSGRLRAVRVGRRLHVPVSALEDFLNPVVDLREAARVALGLLERAGFAPRLRAVGEGFVVEVEGEWAVGLTPSEAAWALAKRLAGPKEV